MSAANGEAREDRGLFGPDSVAWRVVGHPVALIGGMRALIIQSLHPLAMAGVADHSDFKSDPWGRLWRTLDYVHMLVYGGPDNAVQTGRAMRAMHQRINGVAP